MEMLLNRKVELHTQAMNSSLLIYLLNSTSEVVVNILGDNTKDCIKLTEEISAKYEFIYEILDNDAYLDRVNKLQEVSEFILKMDMNCNEDKLVLTDLFTVTLGYHKLNNLNKINNFIENQKDESQLLERIKTRLNIINVNNRIIKLYNLNNFDAIYDTCVNTPFEYFDLIYKNIKHNDLDATLDNKQRERLNKLYMDRIPY